MPTSRSVVAPTSRATSASHGPPHRLSPKSDLRRRRTDESRDVAGADDHGVHSGALELGDLVPGRHAQVSDRKLSGRHVLEEIEHPLERFLPLAVVARREEKDLRI